MSGCKVLYLEGENPLYVTKQRLFGSRPLT
jgi:hypothetical protein